MLMSDANQKNIGKNIARLKAQLANKRSVLVTVAPEDRERIKQQMEDLEEQIQEFEAKINDLPKTEQGVTIPDIGNSSMTKNPSIEALRDVNSVQVRDITSYGGSISVTIQSPSQAMSINPVGSPINQNGDPIYIERPPFERICRERIQESGCVLRITAPRETGKTMLVNRTIAFAKDKGYKIIKIDFKDQRSFNNLNYHDFLSHLCSKLSEILKFYCSNNSGSEECLEYLLSKMNDNLVLALDSFEVLFSRQQDCVDIGYFLRRCHNCSQPDDEQGRIWRKLRIVMAYSTEKIPNFPDINQSPFNIGTMVELKGFTKLQAKELLSRRYNYLDSKLSDIDLDSLVNFLNGHPKLIQQSLDHLNYYPEETMDDFLKKAPTEEGIFRPHLRSILTILRGNQNQCWIKNYRTILLRGRVSSRDIDTPFVLLNLGLIEPSGNDYISSCNLYLKYFSNQFTSN